jgi:hypothetical protein
MNVQFTVFTWFNTYNLTTGAATSLEDAKTQAVEAWKTTTLDNGRPLQWRHVDGKESLYVTNRDDTAWTGVSIESHETAIPANRAVSWVWYWEDCYGQTSPKPYVSVRLARHDAEEHYRSKHNAYRDRLHWSAAEPGDPTDDPDDRFVLQLSVNGKREDYFLRRASIVFEISDAYEVPEELQDMFDQLVESTHDDDAHLARDLRSLLRRHERVITARLGKEAQQ